jgi:hypothetical protein
LGGGSDFKQKENVGKKTGWNRKKQKEIEKRKMEG